MASLNIMGITSFKIKPDNNIANFLVPIVGVSHDWPDTDPI